MNIDYENNKRLVEIVTKNFWGSDIFKSLSDIEMIYGIQIREDFKKLLEGNNEPTAIHAKDMNMYGSPKFLIFNTDDKKKLHYLEYTHSTHDYYEVSRTMNYDKYMKFKTLQNEGVKVALLYLAVKPEFHLKCDFMESIEAEMDCDGEIMKYGSGKNAWVNFDITPMRTLLEFVADKHGFAKDDIEPVFNKTCDELRAAIPARPLMYTRSLAAVSN